MPTILLADDHQVVREGLRALLASQPGFTIVGEVADGRAAVEAIERLTPEVAVVDWTLPGPSGLEVTRQVAQRFPATRVVIFSMHAEEAFVREALRAGALGYVVKDAGSRDLVRAVREVVAGRRYLSPPFLDRAIGAYAGEVADERGVQKQLTRRQQEVLRLSAQGLTHAEVGERLGISRRTAEAHLANLMRKLGLRTKTDLIRHALKQGLIPQE